ncbi:hypothetical protein FNV43_RR05161 [Rhamnella rubrinervis]|uniref:ENTH domain-containing protein n=1 Tax=Rhamnella rubrinervis TaxID=2594499 RepID=A0A8K0HMF4_9ROSA|nr:hypothetical protein FNV43_RR05161 [Rhamnella rubrinervis]
MSILSKTTSENGVPSFREFKKQASFFLKEKIKTARLALTDVTPAQLRTEEATSGNPWAPDTRTLGSISRAAFELEDYTRIVEILHKRLLKFERKNWNVAYNSLIVLEHLLTHGPESVAEEFQGDKDVIGDMESFQYIDEKGFNWGLTVRKKSERILKLLQKGPLLKEERDRARKLSRGIQGFGSFCQRSSSSQGILRTSFETYGRCNSQSNDDESQENQLPSLNEQSLNIKPEKSNQSHRNVIVEFGKKTKSSSGLDSFGGIDQAAEKTETSFKENMAPKEEDIQRSWDCLGESNPLLDVKNDEFRSGVSTEDNHPFSDTENQTTTSLLSGSNAMQGP